MIFSELNLKKWFSKLYVLMSLVGCSYESVKLPDVSSTANDNVAQTDSYSSYTDVDKIQAYGQFLLPVLRAQKCVECHGATQVPKFAVVDSYAAFKAGDKYIDFAAPLGSRFYRRPKLENHNCAPNCDTIAEAILGGLEAYKQQLQSKKSGK